MQSKKIFLAPDAFIAFIDRAHPKHLHAGAFFRYFAQEKYVLYTNEETILTVYEELHTKISPFLAKDFLKAISLGSINILYTEESDMKLTFKTILNSHSADLTMKQALMAVMASRRSIGTICTFDYLHQLFGLTAFYLPI